MSEDISIFLDRVGYSTEMKILEVFIEGRGLEFSITDIVEYTNLAKSTIYSIWEKFFLKQNYIVKTRTIGKTKLFSLNEESQYIKQFIEIFDSAINEELKEEKLEPKQLNLTIKYCNNKKCTKSDEYYKSEFLVGKQSLMNAA